MSGHSITPRTYVKIFMALLGLTAVTVAVAFVNLGPLNTIVALSIAVLKAVLVILFFMHVKESGHLLWVVVGAGFFWLLLLLVFLMLDFLSRGWLPVASF